MHERGGFAVALNRVQPEALAPPLYGAATLPQLLQREPELNKERGGEQGEPNEGRRGSELLDQLPVPTPGTRGA